MNIRDCMSVRYQAVLRNLTQTFVNNLIHSIVPRERVSRCSSAMDFVVQRGDFKRCQDYLPRAEVTAKFPWFEHESSP